MEYTHKPVEELTFTDDFMFGTVMKNKAICKGVIERLLHIKVGKIEYPSLQKTIAPFYESKGIRLDVYVFDSDRVFDIEIQTSIPPSLPKRTRYYQSLMDVDNLLRGQSYAELKESYVIFICTQDPFGKSLPVYEFRNICTADGTLFLDDKSYKVFYNVGAYSKEGEPELSALLEYLCERRATS
ncbi:Rpn family recombination-promoting nuclease/putative transposase, partial [Treponema socranskii]